MPEPLRRAGAGLGLVFALVAPALVTDPTWQGVMVRIGADAVIVLGLTIVFGWAGQISVVQAGLAGVGAYAVAIPSVRYGWSPWWGLVIGVAAAAGLAWLIGKPVLRLEGYYLAMATLAVNILLVVVATHAAGWTGGPYGLAGLPPLPLLGRELFRPQEVYYVVLAFLVLALAATRRLVASPAGRQLQAVRQNPRAAALGGVDVPTLKLKAFVLAAVFAAVGGFLKAQTLLVVVPSQYGVVPSISLIIMLVVGGMHSVWGALLGAMFVNIVPELLAEQVDLQAVVFALAFMAVLLFLPQGLAGGLGRLAAVARIPGRP